MFGILVAGRLVQTEFIQTSETQFLFNIPDADSINHIVVFMTGQVPFPDTMGGAVYFSWPSADGTPGWQLIGHITNSKPSAIFKISNLKKDAEVGAHPFESHAALSHGAQIGVSVETLGEIAQQTPVTESTTKMVTSFVEFTTKMLENCYNYVSSFGVTQAQMTQQPNETFVPLSALHKWYESFQRKMEMNPNFWRS
ncbi:protein Hikeshi-like [Lineus longissimus]|uniref:protein Hikeshi-like n=1 Tax=Lineus longissimus TaxID=88925 RepID=UPI002B4F38B8